MILTARQRSTMNRLFALVALLTIFLSNTLRANELRCDVCVYGATPAGIAAALCAAKAEKEVLLIEPTHQIGGMVTSGLSHTDFHSYESLSGTFLDFSLRVKAYYVQEYGADSEQVKTSYEGTFGEPKINLKIFQEMIAEQESLTVLRETSLTSVQRDDSAISAASFKTPKETINVTAKIFVDATYEGDLMAATGVEYRVGREGQNEYGESLAPQTGDNQLQGYNFRFCATNNPKNRAEVTKPPGYRRDNFLPLIPILKSGKIEQVFGYPSKCIFKAHLPVLPNRKYDINDVSRGLVRLSMPGHNLGWPDGSAAERKTIFEEHLRYNVGLLYFLQNDEAVPEKFRRQANQWGWCKDEFVETNHLPPQLYVREARRMVGKHVYVQQDSEYAPHDARAVFHRTSIAMGDYGNNCHGTFHEGPLIGGRHTGEFYNPVPPYHIPYGVLLPKSVNNLLVPGAVSSSHVGFCGLRLEPIWMSLGQAAGHAAVLAIEGNVTLPSVDVAALQSRLHHDGSATIYVSDVPPHHKDFAAVQWWGSLGGLHGIEQKTASPRGKNLHGQYYEAAPGHAVKLENPLDNEVKANWLKLAETVGLEVDELANSRTRGEFIRHAFQLRFPETASTE